MDLPVNHFKRRALARELQLGSWVMLASPVAAEAQSYAGFDFLVIDMEHSPNEMRDTLLQLQAVQGGGTSAVVRLAWNDPVLIKRALDIGAQTIMLPFIQNAEEARRAVTGTRYPTAGTRGVAGMHRAGRYGMVKDYFKRASDEICVIMQIETPEALDQLPEIVTLDGVDAVFLGPSDLSASMGHLGNVNHPDVMAALRRGVEIVHGAGKPVGIIGGNDALCRAFIDMGFDFVALGTDLSFLMRQATAVLEQFRPSIKATTASY